VNANLKIEGLDLAGSGFTQSAPALAGVVGFEGSGQSDGRIARIKGKLTAEKLRLARAGSAARKPAAFEFALDHDLRSRTGQLHRGDIHIGAAAARLTGTCAADGGTMAVKMALDGPRMPVAELSEMLPAMGIALPHGSSLQGGTARRRS